MWIALIIFKNYKFMFCQIGTKMGLTKVTQTLLQIDLTILLENIVCQERLILLDL